MTPDSSFPTLAEVITLPSGTRVTVLNLVVFVQRGEHGGRLGIQYRSSISASDPEAQLAEAREVVVMHAAFADARGYTMSAQICNTVAAAENREPPERAFYFARDGDGAWALQFSVGADGQRGG